jgi:hypothetical protein
MSDLTTKKPTDVTIQKPKRDAGSEIDAFVQRSRAVQAATGSQRGRVIFALDATASRQQTWDAACEIQAEMFHEVSGLNVQLVYFRGHDECRASGWISSRDRLANLMRRIACKTGGTQIGKVLTHTRRETEKNKVQALVYVGDCMEEDPDELADIAAILGVPVFMFQEGNDRNIEQTYREIARLTHGAYCRFDVGAADQLAKLLRGVAAYAANGIKALESRPGAAKLLEQLRR